MIFSSRDFDVKWVDDSHALIVFSNANAANEALKFVYPNIKLRPLSQAIRESRVKARKCSGLHSYHLIINFKNRFVFRILAALQTKTSNQRFVGPKISHSITWSQRKDISRTEGRREEKVGRR